MAMNGKRENKPKASAPDLDALLRQYIAQRRAMPGHRDRVAALNELIAKTIPLVPPSATLHPDDIDLIIGPSIPDPQADAELPRLLAARRKEPGHAKRVAALKRTIRKTETASRPSTPNRPAKPANG